MIKRLKYIVKILINKELLKVYSHPRSGTHFLEAFIAKNFYKNLDLKTTNVIWGHWSNRKTKAEGNPYGKLFGNHFFAERNTSCKPRMYIIRDVRAVAYSIWKTDNFLNADVKKLTIKEFLDYKLDWYGTPARKHEKEFTIVEHWSKHVAGWLELNQDDRNLLIVRYEDLVERPYLIYEEIRNRFFRHKPKKSPKHLIEIKKPIGLLPNKATIDSWKTAFDKDDIKNIYASVPPKLHKYLVD
jgi:hypothetical protein